MTKHIFVTGGVVSSLGKGLNAASIGMLLESHGHKIILQKFDPYVNVDPGTMARLSMERFTLLKMVRRQILIWAI